MRKICYLLVLFLLTMIMVFVSGCSNGSGNKSSENTGALDELPGNPANTDYTQPPPDNSPDNPYIVNNSIFAGVVYPANAYYGSAIFPDVDGDGDQDMVLGTFGGATDLNQNCPDPNDFVYNNFPYYYENTGTGEKPGFTRRTGEENPFSNCKGSFHLKPDMADLDGDGDLDLVFYNMKWYPRYQAVHYFENTGDKYNPAFEAREGDDNPFKELSFPHLTMSIKLVDLNNDGDFDLTSCNHREVRFYENTGNARNPAFVDRSKSDNDPFKDLVLSGTYYNVHTMGDVDNDGDIDLVSGGCYGRNFAFYMNVGTPELPDFEVKSGNDNPLRTMRVNSNWSHPSLYDMDNDGDLDLISGEYNPGLSAWENRSYEIVVMFENPGSNDLNINPGSYSTPAFNDLDNDGDLDLVSGRLDGDFVYYENLGSSTSPFFQETENNPFENLYGGRCSAPALGDIDGDGDPDLISGNNTGTIVYFRNTGSVSDSVFEEQTGFANPFDTINLNGGSNPRLADIDNDGDLDLLITDEFSELYYFRNDGDSTNPLFTEISDAAENPFSVCLEGEGYGQILPALADFDKDNDLDMITSNYKNEFRYFKNIGTSTIPEFKEYTGNLNPLNDFTCGNFASPVFADIYGNDAPVLVIGSESGTLQQINLVNDVFEGVLFF